MTGGLECFLSFPFFFFAINISSGVMFFYSLAGIRVFYGKFRH